MEVKKDSIKWQKSQKFADENTEMLPQGLVKLVQKSKKSQSSLMKTQE